MPEGPEISYMTKLLKNNFINSKLKKIIINDNIYSKKMPLKFKKFIKLLPSKIINIGNKGKFIYFSFNNNINLCITLSLTGHFILNKDKYITYEFITSKGKFYLQDVRKFTRFYFLNNEEFKNKLNIIGPNILHDKISFNIFKNRINKRRNSKIGSVLLNQKFISGVGNYIRSDSLYDAKINPFRYVKDLNDSELNRIYKSIKKIIKRSYKQLIKKNNIKGYEFLVYRRKITKKGEIIIRDRLEKNRNIYWCPEVQK